MNNKLIELAAQCGMHFGQDNITHMAFVTPPGRHEEGVPLAKFAELIVRQCMAVVSATKNEAIDLESHVDEAMSLAESDIAREFGIRQ